MPWSLAFWLYIYTRYKNIECGKWWLSSFILQPHIWWPATCSTASSFTLVSPAENFLWCHCLILLISPSKSLIKCLWVSCAYPITALTHPMNLHVFPWLSPLLLAVLTLREAVIFLTCVSVPYVQNPYDGAGMY